MRCLRGMLFTSVGVLLGAGIFFGTFLALTLKSDQAKDRQRNEPSETFSFSIDLDTEQNDLADLKSLPTEFFREVALYKKLLNANLDESLNLLNESGSIASPNRKRHTRVIILRRIAEIDPRRALEQIDNFPLGEHDVYIKGVFSEWSQTDLSAAVQYASTMKQSQKMIALSAILQTRDDLTDDERYTLGLEIGTEQQVSALLNDERVDELILTHGLEDAWNFVTHDNVNDAMQLESLVQIAEIGIEEEGLEFVSRVIESYSDWEDPAIVLRTLHDTILQSIYADPMSAFKDSMTMSGDSGDLVRQTALRTWAKIQPVAALQAVSTYEPEDARRNLQRVVLGAWAQTDPQEILEQLNIVPREFRSFAREAAIDGLVSIPATQAVQLLKDPANRLMNKKNVNRFVQMWLYKDGEAALNWVLTEPAIEDVRDFVLGNVLVRLAIRDPERALRIALQSPKYERQEWEVEHDVTVIKSLVQTNIEKALELVTKVSDESRYESYSIIGQALVERREFDRALQLAALVPVTNRTQFEFDMVSIWGSYYWKELFDHLSDFPAHIQSRAARIVIGHNSRERFLSEQDLHYASSLLNEEDLEFVSDILSD